MKYSGGIVDYNKLKSINFNTNGSINTDDLIKLIGREFKPFIHSQGSIPVKLTFDGDRQKQTLFAQAMCDKENFLTPVDFKNTAGLTTTIQSVVDFKPGRIKIKKTGLFKRTVNVDEDGNEIVKLDEIFGIDGTIAGDRINLIKITMPKAMSGNIYAFPQSEFGLKGRAFVFGELKSPRLRGGYEVTNLSIPELLLTLKQSDLDFKGHSADFAVRDLMLNGSDMQINGTFSTLPSTNFEISKLDVSSKYLNVDKVMNVSERALKYAPKTPAKTSASSQPADIPVIIYNGSINFARIVTGNIDIRNTQAGISLANNIFNIRNLRTRAFDGRVRGNISMNLITSLLNIRLTGRGIDVEKALLDAAGMKDTLSGTAAFETDISLKGATYEEQMRSLKGTVGFDVRNGQFGPFGKLENLIIAENIRESQLFQTALGGVISGLTTIDTTHFAELKGTLSFNDGICNLNPITSLGNILSLHIAGEFDLLRNYADMKVEAVLDERKIEDKRLDLDEILAKIQKNFKKADIKDNLKIIVEPPKREIRELRLLADKFRDLQISGIKDIGKVIIRKDEREWIMHTEGSNLKDILSMEGIDTYRTTTNDIHEIETVLGIEAARQSIINEARNTLENQGLSVDVRHIMLVADIMTSEGEVKSIGRHGISGEKSSVLARAAFEETGKHLLRASIRGEVDDLTGIIENIIIGQPIPLGTGSIGVKMANKNE